MALPPRESALGAAPAEGEHRRPRVLPVRRPAAGAERAVHQRVPARPRCHRGAAGDHLEPAIPPGVVQAGVRVPLGQPPHGGIPSEVVHVPRMDDRQREHARARPLQRPGIDARGHVGDDRHDRRRRRTLHPLPLPVPAPLRDGLLVRGRHGRFRRGREGQAGTGALPRAPAEHVLRVPFLRAHDRSAFLHGHVLDAGTQDGRAGHGRVASVDAPADLEHVGAEECAGQINKTTVRGDMDDSMFPCCVAAHGFRIPVQLAPSGKCSVEGVPQIGPGLHI
mmetsp:Transcript_47183/g.142880  ORF Transcript_47183/g.142880 Transcript_47183/m.142880 type:complete len:279 (-) Transcript_47183:744-1580(-)